MSLLPDKLYFDNFLDDFFVTDKDFSKTSCDIYEEDGKYHVEMDLPGYKKEDVSVDCTEGYLTIEANKSSETKEKKKNYLRQERTFGKIQRKFYVGNINTADIKAEFRDGVLNVVVPHQEQKKIKNVIEIE